MCEKVASITPIPAAFTLESLQQGQIALELHKQPNSMNAMVAERAVLSVIERVSAAVDIAKRSHP